MPYGNDLPYGDAVSVEDQLASLPAHLHAHHLYLHEYVPKHKHPGAKFKKIKIFSAPGILLQSFIGMRRCIPVTLAL